LNDYSDSIGWPIKDPGWIGKIVIQSLINIIPIVGQIALIGWMLAAVDNLRAGRLELPGAGFSFMGRGLNLFLVFLIYLAVCIAVFVVVIVVGFVLISTAANNNVGALGVIGGLFVALGYAILILAGLAFYFLMAPIVVATERGGIGGGLNLPQIVAMARTRGSATLFAGLFALVGGLIGSLCAYITIAYGYAVMAGVIAVYERQIPSAPRLDQTGGHA
jgi:uncharacterized protein DUF4013